MLGQLRSWFTQQPLPAQPPSPVTITGIRFPANGSMPHTLSLTTTTHKVKDEADAPWGHIPDFRPYWKTQRAWEWRDFDIFRLENEPLSSCNGLYVVYYSFDSEALPTHSNFPEGIFGRQRSFSGDAFIFRLQGTKIEEDLGKDGWAVWIDVPSDILSLPVMKVGRSEADTSARDT